MSSPQKQPVVSFSAVVAAGFASATAAVITSRFGVAGTLLGAALTSMIITGGSAVLKAYFERVSGQVRQVPDKIRTQTSRVRRKEPAAGDAWEQASGPDSPGNTFVERLRASLGWFSRLPALRRRSILVGALVPALVAFCIGAGAVTAMEVSIGETLSCAVWDRCAGDYAGAGAPGVGLSILGGNRIVGADPENIQEQPQQQDVQDAPVAQPAEPAPPAPPAATTPSNYGTTPLETTTPGTTVEGIPGQ